MISSFNASLVLVTEFRVPDNNISMFSSIGSVRVPSAASTSDAYTPN